MQTEQIRGAFEIVKSIHDKLNSKPPRKASYHDIDFLIKAPKGTCRIMVDLKRKRSKYLAALIEVEQLYS